MEEQGSDFKEMLNTMKAVEFRQKKEENLTRLILQTLKVNSSKTYHIHYKMTLYCKVFKSLMMSSLQLRTFEERLEDVYVRILLKNHFEAMKEFKLIVGDEREEKIKSVRNIVKRGQIRVFMSIVSEKIRKQRKKIQKNEESRVQEFKYKTDTHFFPSKEPQSYLSKYTGFKYPLEDSRRSALSSFSQTSEFQSKRKFAVVKQLPKMPDLQSVVEQQRQLNSSEVIPHLESPLNLIKEEGNKSQIRSISMKRQQAPSAVSQIQYESKVEESMREGKDISKKQSTYDREQIISRLCQIKMLEITHMQSIIQDYSQNLKYESLINQKNNLSQNIATLNHLLTL